MKQLADLLAVFAGLSLLTVGGGMAAFPMMEHETVGVHHWMTQEQLVHFIGVGQVVPGPNMMVVASIGAWTAGPLGALAAVLAFFVPTALLVFAAGRLWNRLAAWPWRAAIQRGLGPVSVGLLTAGTLSLTRSTSTGLATMTVALCVMVLALRTKINPALLILAFAPFGLLSLR